MFDSCPQGERNTVQKKTILVYDLNQGRMCEKEFDLTNINPCAVIRARRNSEPNALQGTYTRVED